MIINNKTFLNRNLVDAVSEPYNNLKDYMVDITVDGESFSFHFKHRTSAQEFCDKIKSFNDVNINHIARDIRQKAIDENWKNYEKNKKNGGLKHDC